MKKIISFLLLATSILGCKKNQTPSVKTPVYDNKKLLLASEIDLDKTGKDTLHTYYYQYNEQNRMTNRVEKDNSSSIPYLYTITYQYDETGNITSYQFNGENILVSYNDNNEPQQLIFNSDKNPKYGSSSTKNILIYNGNVVKIYDSVYPLLAYDSITYVGSNISSINYGDIAYSYGKNKNPLYYSGFKWYLGFPFPLAGQNEVVGVDSTESNIASYTKYKYTYNNSGFPAKGTATDKNGNITGQIIYSYIPAK